MIDYKLLFLDIDGTLLLPDDSIEESTRKAVSQVQEKGIEVFLATGRPIHEIRELAEELHIQSFIGYNGAYAIYKGNDLFQEPIDSKIVTDFTRIAKENQHEMVLYTNHQNLLTTMDSPPVEKFIKHFRFHQNDLYTPSMAGKVLGLTLVNVKEDETALYKHCEGVRLSQVNVEGMQNCYDMIMEKVNKGYGVQMVLKHLNLEKECAIAFGDGMNDKEMLLAAGESFAMANSHPDLFQYAKHKTTDVTNSGIYNGLKHLGLVR